MSVGPPGGNPTIMVIGRNGKVWAPAMAGNAASAVANAPTKHVRFIAFPSLVPRRYDDTRAVTVERGGSTVDSNGEQNIRTITRSP